MSVLDGFLVHHESGHFRHRSAYLIRRDRPRDLLLIWVIRGGLDVQVGDRSLSAGAGDLVTLPPGRPHRYVPTSDRGWEWLWLHVGGAAVPELTAQLITRGNVRQIGADPQVRSRFDELVTVATTAPDPVPAAPQLHLDSCAYSLLGLILDRGSPAVGDGSPILLPVTSWIHDHLDSPITLAELAKVAGWSEPHLSRLMQRHLGTSPMRYVTRVRIREATRLLTDTELSISEVARRVGYLDPLHFSRRFRQVTGMPPTHARRERPAGT